MPPSGSGRTGSTTTSTFGAQPHASAGDGERHAAAIGMCLEGRKQPRMREQGRTIEGCHVGARDADVDVAASDISTSASARTATRGPSASATPALAVASAENALRS